MESGVRHEIRAVCWLAVDFQGETLHYDGLRGAPEFLK